MLEPTATLLRETVLQSTNIRASSCRVWIDYLDDATIKAHARDVENFGVKNPYGNAYMTVSGSAFGGKYRELDGGITPIPQMETLALNWDFATLTSSNASGQFIVPDASSGSAALTPSNAQGRTHFEMELAWPNYELSTYWIRLRLCKQRNWIYQ